MQVTEQALTTMGVSASNAARYVPELNRLLAMYNVSTPLRVAHFLAQVCHESGKMRVTEENLNYTAERLLQVFPRYFSSRSAAEAAAGRPEAIGNIVYNRSSLGNTTPGDGYRYRGRGLIQVTGKANYRELADFLGVDVVADPDLVKNTYAVGSAVWYWHSRNLNQLADADDVQGVTRRINGGQNGLPDRTRLLLLAKEALAADTTPSVPPEELLGHVSHHVKTQFEPLTLRSSPAVQTTRIAMLPSGTAVDVVEGSTTEADGRRFVKVRAALNGAIASGWVDSRYLEATGLDRPVEPPTPPPGGGVEPVVPTHRVKTAVSPSLALMALPGYDEEKLADLPDGAPVEVTPGSQTMAFGAEWVRVRAVVDGRVRIGHVVSSFLAVQPSRASAAPAPMATPPAPVGAERATHRVATISGEPLTMRQRPSVVAPWVASLHVGMQISVVADSEVEGRHTTWVLARATTSGGSLSGWVPTESIAALVEPIPPPAPESVLPEAHLPTPPDPVTRANDHGRAHHLREPRMPRRTATTATTRADQLVRIVEYLDPERAGHRRYEPKSVDTYCNIYAHDYAFLAKAFLPRVWWTDPALRHIREGVAVSPVYDRTVRELNANALHDWLHDFGAEFGWARVFDLDTLQTAADQGQVCLITAKRADVNRPGHIVAVVPEHGQRQAVRDRAGNVVRPLQSQSGRTNRTFFTHSRRWWTADYYADHAFWRHA